MTTGIKPSGTRKVLVVDDNPDAANSLAMLLRLEFHEVQVAYDGASALLKAQQCPPDVVFLDLALPHMDGYKVARLLQEQSATKHPLIVAVTGLMPERYRQRSVDAGIAHYITKPFEFTEVREILYQFAECCSSNADRKEPIAVPVADSSQYSGVATEPERE